MNGVLNTGNCKVYVAIDLIKIKAYKSRRWLILFDGRDDGRRFDLTTEAIKAVAASDGFDDDIADRLRQLLARPNAVWQF